MENDLESTHHPSSVDLPRPKSLPNPGELGRNSGDRAGDHAGDEGAGGDVAMKWPSVPVGEIAQQVRGVSYDKSQVSNSAAPGLRPVLRAGNIQEGSLLLDKDLVYVPDSCIAHQQLLRPGDIVIAASSGSIDVVGKAAQLSEPWEGSFGAFCKVVRPSSDKVNPRYLHHFFQSTGYRRKVSSLAAGANINNLKNEHIDDLLLPLPPLEEQRRIAAILDRAADLNSLSKRADQLVIDLRVSRLRQLLSSEVSHRSKSKYVPLSDLIRGKPNNGIFRKNPEYQDPTSSGLPVVWVEQLFRGEVLELSACKKLDATNAEIAKYGLTNGDILFCRSSLKLAGIAKSNIYVGADGQALFECHLIRISPDPAKINPIFLNECLNLPEIRDEARRLSKTSTMTTIDQDGILAIAVPLPPLHIQEQFAQDFALFQHLSTRRRESNHAISLFTASLASLQLDKT
jgi:type I restriction enzyme S subunit